MMPHFLQSAFLAGLAALAVPILIHLFFRLKTKHVELGTIRFLRQVIEENARRRRVMQWLLLALRMAFVALLVGVFARPYLMATASGGDKDLMVIVIDQSATMQLKGDHGRLIDMAIAEAKKLVASASPGTRFEFAFFDHSIHPVTAANAGEETSIQKLLEPLRAPSMLVGATNYGAVIAWVRDICVKSPPGRKQLHLFTDLQRSGLEWTEVEPIPAEVQFHLHDLGNSVVNNVAITEIRTPRLWVRPGEEPSIQVSILHGGVYSLTEVPIVLEIGRVDEEQQQDVAGTADFSKLAARITKRERIKLEPGTTVTVNFDLPPLSEGLWQGRVLVEYDDELMFDNQRYFAISATPAYRVLVLDGGASRSAAINESYFLETSLRLAPPGQSFLESPFAPEVQLFPEGAALPNLRGFDAVVLVDVGGMSQSDAERLAAFVAAGGGLLVFTGDNVSAPSCSALTAAGLDVGAIGDPKVTVDLPWRLSKWDQTHPVFQLLSDPQHGDLRRLIFAAYTHIDPSPEAAVLMTFGTGDPAVLERRAGEGTVIWFTVSCGRDWSDWSRSRLFLPIVHQLLGYEVGLAQGGRIRTRLVDVEPKSDGTEHASTDKARGETNRGETNAIRKSSTPSHVEDAASLGVWRFKRHTLVVNTSPRESDAERCGRQEFENRFGVKFVDDDGSSASGRTDNGNIEMQQDEVWHWAACALLAVILLEGFVGNRTTA